MWLIACRALNAGFRGYRPKSWRIWGSLGAGISARETEKIEGTDGAPTVREGRLEQAGRLGQITQAVQAAPGQPRPSEQAEHLEENTGEGAAARLAVMLEEATAACAAGRSSTARMGRVLELVVLHGVGGVGLALLRATQLLQPEGSAQSERIPSRGRGMLQLSSRVSGSGGGSTRLVENPKLAANPDPTAIPYRRQLSQPHWL